MRARKGTVLLQALIGITTVYCGAIGYTGYGSVSHLDINNYATDQDASQPIIYQQIVYDSGIGTSNNLYYIDALPLLRTWSNAECSVNLQGSNIQIPFPQTLPAIKTICEGSMATSSPMQSFSVVAQFAFIANPEAIRDSPTYETDELSIWAGQPEFGYASDVEWGIVARIYDGNVYMFLQIGDGNRTFKFQQVLLHKVDGESHTYSCALSSASMGDVDTITLECVVDTNPPVFITISNSGASIPSSYGLVAKSMRVSPETTSIVATLTVTKLEYAP